jgi:hypothetical protein
MRVARGSSRRVATSPERGANLIEFAIVMPLLVLLVLGIVEFSWLLATNLDVNQGAREGARLTAVNTPAGNAALRTEICSRMSIVGDDAATTITWDGDGSPAVGEGVIVTVATPVDTLTGLIDFFFAGLTNLESAVEIRIEQPPTWSDQTLACP